MERKSLAFTIPQIPGLVFLCLSPRDLRIYINQQNSVKYNNPWLVKTKTEMLSKQIISFLIAIL